MMSRLGLATAAMFVLCTWMSGEAQAQIGRTMYTPDRPTFSPYFGYFQANGTSVPNYYAFVRPGRQYQDRLLQEKYHNTRAIMAENDRLSLQTARITDDLTRRLSVRTSTGIGAPSQAATFQQYSHFYRTPEAPARR